MPPRIENQGIPCVLNNILMEIGTRLVLKPQVVESATVSSLFVEKIGSPQRKEQRYSESHKMSHSIVGSIPVILCRKEIFRDQTTKSRRGRSAKNQEVLAASLGGRPLRLVNQHRACTRRGLRFIWSAHKSICLFIKESSYDKVSQAGSSNIARLLV